MPVKLGYWNVRAVSYIMFKFNIYIILSRFEKYGKRIVFIKFLNDQQFAQPIRLLLAYGGADVEEKRYNFIGDNWDRSEWLNEKFTFGFDFPNVRTFKIKG